MKISEIASDLLEGLAPDFHPAAYGYWIDPEGNIHNIEKNEGHIDFLMDWPGDDFMRLSPTQPKYDWYDAALDAGWIRVIASKSNDSQMNIQYSWFPSKKSKYALLNLVTGLMPYQQYYIENSQETFNDPKTAARQISQAARNLISPVKESKKSETWTK